MTTKHELGQYFTTNTNLKNKVYEFILNSPECILEPSIGCGDLVTYVLKQNPYIIFDMYEIDTNIKLLDEVYMDDVIYGDFIKQTITKSYKTIIGNPPYVRTSTGNLYIDFIKKCYELLDTNGELIFIVPSDFFKLTCASKLLHLMLSDGTFTHIYHPNDEKLFENASIDIIIFRYQKNNMTKKVLYNDTELNIINSNGLITFSSENLTDSVIISDYFDVYVGLVTGLEDVYKNNDLGNIDVLNGQNKIDKYIFINDFPSDNEQINEYLIKHKKQLLSRKIRKFNEKNWFEWGAPRNISTIKSNIGTDCIYMYNLTRRSDIAFINKVNYFGGGLIMLIPKKTCDLENIVKYFNSSRFKNNFMFSGRFKIGHRQIVNSYIPLDCL
jgi:adenine-specific DNA-methyltransferase